MIQASELQDYIFPTVHFSLDKLPLHNTPLQTWQSQVLGISSGEADSQDLQKTDLHCPIIRPEQTTSVIRR